VIENLFSLNGNGISWAELGFELDYKVKEIIGLP
jgi:hypothetical protein